MAPLEPWEKVLVDGEAYPETAHGQIACTDCHSGIQDADKETAHTGLITDPSLDASNFCGECHEEMVAMNEYSLHSNLTGYWTVLDERRDLADAVADEAMHEMFGNHCDSCHATCGECHVSQPALVGGGLIDGHMFNKTPSMTRNCTACHGSRVGNEYLGKHEDLAPDVHFRQGRMNCIDCHDSSHDMHGQPNDCESCHVREVATADTPPDHRYTGPQSPQCETCHPTVGKIQDDNEMHQEHAGELQCQVCHSIAYTSCDGCHVAISENTGNPFFATDANYLTFYIGRNPRKSAERPYEYVLVRHIPVAPDSFSFYGDDLLPNFDSLPNWKYTTPHNIQLQTPQTESCNACHGNPDYFLTIDKIQEDEIEANQAIIIETIPDPLPENGEEP